MPTKNNNQPLHPGAYIKNEVLPTGLSVKAAAELLGVGRPALSNLLNGNAALSPEMALRLERTFGISQKDLLERQARFEQFQSRTRERNVAVRAYVPSFLKITARDIENWAHGNLQARSVLAVFLRKLVHSTGQELSHVDFPGYDNAERKGWDGQVEAGAATPWVPLGKSGWEFGCNEEPKQKAEGDYAARVNAIPTPERTETNFVFVTPRTWKGKDNWAKEKQALGEWKSVRAYDASTLEQWLEQSIPAQGWMAEQMGRPDEGAHSLDEQWRTWASVTEPELPKAIFEPSVERHRATLATWLKSQPSAPLIVCADSKAEALAFLSCIFEADEFAPQGYKDRAIVFSSAETLRKLLSTSSNFIPVVFTEEAERELGGVYRKLHMIIIRPRNTVEAKPDVVLDLLNHEAFRKALKAMGIDDHGADTLARESGYSPTILRRRLSRNPAIKTPPWTQDAGAVESIIPMMLVGAWHAQSNADCEILSFLAGTPYSRIEKQIAVLLKFDDPPVWSVGRFRGVSSKIDALFAVHASVTQKDLDDFLFAAETVLSETDPALDLPEDNRPFAGLYGKSREHSGALREGICEMLVLLAVHGNNLFSERLGVKIEAKVNALIRRLLTPLTVERLLSPSGDLPLYAEAAPEEFLKIIEEDLGTAEPQIYALMKPADSGIFGGGCPRSGLLWALENLAWNPDHLLRVSVILAKLSERKIDDNWVDKPENSLLSIYRSWMPQTVASLDDRKKALEALTKRFPRVAWQVCLDQFTSGTRVGNPNHRARWRSDASGAGLPVMGKERYEFARKALDLALAWTEHDENTLGDLIGSLQGLLEEDQRKVWDIVAAWAKTEKDDKCRAILRERIRRFALTRRSKLRRIKSETKDRAREAYELLTPQDAVVRHQWLFTAPWVDESADELEDENLDFEKRGERVAKERVGALQEIWRERGFEGIHLLLAESGATFAIGWHMAEGVIDKSQASDFLKQCVGVNDSAITDKMDEVVRGFLLQLDAGRRQEITAALLASLPAAERCRLLKCSPFQRETWLHVDSQEVEISAQYWHEINPGWMRRDSPDINEVVDRLLEARRPRAAFQAVHFALAEVETSRLKRLLHEIAACDFEGAGTYRVDAHYLSSALEILQGRPCVTRDEMAQLELLFIRALDHSEHGIPNLERQLSESPSLFMHALVLAFERSEDGEDPPEWRIDNPEQREAVAQTAYVLLDEIKRIPGTDDDGTIKASELKAWLAEVRSLCSKHGRAKIGDQKIGQILAAAPVGNDGVWPCEAVREALEEIGSEDIAIGMRIGVYNSRGVHLRGEGGNQERELAEKYRHWSRQLAFEYPYVSNLVAQIASQYDHEAAREDSEAAVRRRLRH